jgi:hypothetical protein
LNMPETPTVRQLDKILQVNDDTYEVNAVYADEAGKVHNPLVIKKQISWTETDTALNNSDGQYNGYRPENINIVPAEGGYFTGPIHVKNASDFDGLTDVERLTLAINRADITTLLTRLTGAPAYLWRDSQLLPIVLDISVPQSSTQGDTESTTEQETAESEVITTVYAKISFIFGDYKDFDAFIASNAKPDIYLYICIDDSRTAKTEANNCASNIYLGGDVLFASSPRYIRIASHADLANRALNADNADKATESDKATYSHSLRDTDTLDEYSYDTLHEILEGIQADIDEITGDGDESISGQLAAHNTDKAAHSYLLTCIKKILRLSSIPAETSDHFQVYNSQRLAGKNESKFQKRIFIGTEAQRNAMALAYADRTTGTPTFVEGDIWIKLES